MFRNGLSASNRQKVLLRHGYLRAKYELLKSKDQPGEEDVKVLRLLFASLKEIEELLDEDQILKKAK